ncbi:ATP-dependent Clp protease proteolytic subunit [Bacillus toyonensis]|uniref:ATP-dependent Clp protease proteolytic subunit n=1 Tax=Bacillus toyonensis TaxID=155322 RepID=UPI002E228AA1|nr:ATP-dependent Clp protease proteolytic subunit [Bacillus toyonensis]
MNYIPYVTEETNRGEKTYDLFTRLLQDRIILLNGEVNENMALSITAQLLYLESQDPDKDITIYINSPGGSVVDGMAIYDTMNFIKPDVSTVCMGLAASMGAFLLSSGAKGKRFALPNAEIMIHQPLGGARGQATDIEISAKRIVEMKERLTRIIANNASQDFEKVLKDCERDYWMMAKEAKEYGIVDDVITRK